MMSFGNEVRGEVGREMFFDRQRSCACLRDKAYAMADTEDVGVDCHSGFAVDDGLDDVCCLSAYSGEADQFFGAVGYSVAEFFMQHFCHALKVAGFAVGVADAADILVYVFSSCLAHGFRGGEGVKEGRSDAVNPLVRALG